MLNKYAALHHHLAYNHFPALPTTLVQTCLDAIDACNEGDPDRQVDLPDDMLISVGGGDPTPTIRAGDMVDMAHLQDMLDDETTY